MGSKEAKQGNPSDYYSENVSYYNFCLGGRQIHYKTSKPKVVPNSQALSKVHYSRLVLHGKEMFLPPLVSKNCFAQQFSSHQRNTHRWNLFQLICNLHGLVSKFKTFTKFCSRAAISGNDWIFSDALNLVFHLSEAYQKAFLGSQEFHQIIFHVIISYSLVLSKVFCIPLFVLKICFSLQHCNIWWNSINWRWKRLDEWFYFPIVVFIIPLPFTCVKKYT